MLLERPAQATTVSQLLARMRSSFLTEADVRRHLNAFEACGLAAERDGRYSRAPADAQMEAALDALVKLYNERPVTLIRAIYARGEERIRAFSDAFKIG